MDRRKGPGGFKPGQGKAGQRPGGYKKGPAGGGKPGAPRPAYKPGPAVDGKPSAPRGPYKPKDGKPSAPRPAYKPGLSQDGKPGAPRPAYKPGLSQDGKPSAPRPAYKPGPAVDGKPSAPRGPYRPKDGKPSAPRGSFRPGQGKGPRPGGNRGPARPAPAKVVDGPQPTRADARKVALMALSDVKRSGAYAQLALSEHLRAARALSQEDKRLATMIFYAALENKLRLQYVLKQFVADMPEGAVEDVLHIGAAQLLFMDRVPDHAAVDEAVKQIKALGRERYAPLVNGALRSLIRARDGGQIAYPNRDGDQVQYLSVMHSLPEGLARRLIDQYGMDEAAAMIAYRPDERKQTVRPNMLKLDDSAFEAYLDQRGFRWEKGIVPHAYHLKGAGDLASDPGFRTGMFSVQGEGSMLPCYAVAPQGGQSILDACAAPGGKSALLCEMMHLTGRVQAWELHEHRCELIRAAKQRLKLDNLRVAARDASVHREEYDMAFDAVLIDAPCSGLGVMIDKPDIKYKVDEAGIQSLAAIQGRILDACAPYVRLGGYLVYATCTILKEENQDQIDAFLRRHPGYRLDADNTFLPEALRDKWQGGWAQFQAHRDGIEGFFIARMVREA